MEAPLQLRWARPNLKSGGRNSSLPSRQTARVVSRRPAVRVRNESLLIDDDLQPGRSPKSSSEFSQTFEPTVFTQDRWASHRRTTRYLRHLKGLLHSGTVRNLSGPLKLLSANAGLIALYNSIVTAQPSVLPFHLSLPELHLPDAPFELVSFALSLLLVFRTDNSHSRWEEALRTFNGVKASSVELLRLAHNIIDDPALRQMFIRWVVVFSRALKVVVTKDGDIIKETDGLLSAAEQHRLSQADHYPHYVLDVLASIVKEAGVVGGEREERIMRNLSAMNAAVTTCEKILQFPIPLSYTRHTSRCMFMFLALLPLALWDDCSWGVIPITTMLAYLLLGVEEIGVQIEEPFSQMPLGTLCKDISDAAGNASSEQPGIQDLIRQSRAVADFGGLHAAGVASVVGARPGGGAGAAGTGSDTAAGRMRPSSGHLSRQDSKGDGSGLMSM